MTTYSLGVTGAVAGPPSVMIQNSDVPDTSANGNVAATTGGLANCARLGDLLLVKGPDGAQHWYRLDAERTTNNNQPYLVYVGP